MKQRSSRTASLNPSLTLIELSKQGVTSAKLRAVQKGSPFSEAEWSSFLNVNVRTLQRYKHSDARLDVATSERILMIEQLLERGVSLFGAKERFELWLRTPSIPLGGKAPGELLSTATGILLLQDELTAIEHGLFA